MLCRNPYIKGMHAFGCGQCMPCRLNKRRQWCHRIFLEALQYDHSAFITLTYSDQNLSLTSDGLPTLNQKHLQDWLKRFRKTITPSKVRYYAVGEYGDETQRPHYHVALFGYRTCDYVQSRYSKIKTNCCPQCDTVRDTWGLGQVFLGTLELDSAQYIAGYVTKKLTNRSDFRLHGRAPEFGRMSLKPGIGAGAIPDIASSLLEFNLHLSQVDVPSHLRHGQKLLPLGRYLRQKLRMEVGKEKTTPQEVLDAQQEEMRPLYEAAQGSSQRFGVMEKALFQQALVDEGTVKVSQMDFRAKLKARGIL